MHSPAWPFGNTGIEQLWLGTTHHFRQVIHASTTRPVSQKHRWANPAEEHCLLKGLVKKKKKNFL